MPEDKHPKRMQFYCCLNCWVAMLCFFSVLSVVSPGAQTTNEVPQTELV